VGTATTALSYLNVFHEECVRATRETLDKQELEILSHEGAAMSFDEAVDYVLGANT
jgi:hypothetical protein